MKRTRILLADDHAVVRQGFKMILGAQADMEIIGEAANGREAVELFAKNTFDLVLIDLEMPEMDGITALGEIKKINPNIQAIAFTAAVYDNMRADLLEKGFKEFVPKPFRPEDLHSKIATLITLQNRA